MNAPEAGNQLEMSVNMSAVAPQLQFMNLYGAKGVGKKELLTDIAWQLILKNVFKDGVYRVDCEVVKTGEDDKAAPRSVLQYIEAEHPFLYKKLTEADKKLDMLLIMLNTHRISDLDGDELIRIVQ